MKQKIKVAFFAETLQKNYDGAVRTMYQIIQRIPSDQFEFLFICGDDIVASLPFRTISLPSVYIPFNRNYKITIPFLSNHWLTKQLDIFQADVIHIATPSPLGNFALNYAKTRQVPSLSIYHTHFIAYVNYYLQQAPVLIKPIKNHLIKKYITFYDACDLVYIPTLEMENALSQIGHQTSHFKRWKRGIDNQLFHPSKRNKQWLQQRIGNTKPIVLFASRLVWEKNLEVLIDLYQLNMQQNNPYNIVVVGDGVAMDTLKQKMPNAYFFGQVEHQELATIYASADIFFFPSITETYGNVVVEAMASGLPCVIANGGGSKSFITQGQNGFVCSPNDANEYFDKITQLLSNENLYQQFVKEGLLYTENMSWDQLVNTYFKDLVLLSNTQKRLAV